VLERIGGPGAFVQSPTDAFPVPGGTQAFPHVGDWDGDGDMDVVVQRQRAHFFENDGANRFTAAATPLIEKDDDFYGGGAGFADFDADGVLDYAGPRALLHGDGTFHDLPRELPGLSLAFSTPFDWEGDGDTDLVHADGTVSVNDGSGAFANVAGLFATPPAGHVFDLPIPVVPGLLGRTLFVRALVLDPGAAGGVAVTNGLELCFGSL
jgi:hypothetical protein